MPRKNKLYPVTEKKSGDNSSKFTLLGGYISIKIDNIHQHLQETNRGYGVVKSKKTYNRKKNHQNTYNSDGSFYWIYNDIVLFT